MHLQDVGWSGMDEMVNYKSIVCFICDPLGPVSMKLSGAGKGITQWVFA